MSAASSRSAARGSAAARPESRALRLGGLTPLSQTDYPGRLAAVLFCQGCPWRCGYCHNPHLTPAAAPPALGWERAADFLRRRMGLLDAVVFSGGEPTAQAALPAAVAEVKALGFKVGLHTAGAYPGRLASILPQLDWVGLDVKAPFERCDALTGAPGSGESARESLRLLVDAGVDHECRTTVHPALLTAEELAELSRSLLALGARRHVLQAFRAQGCADEALRASADPEALERLLRRALELSPRTLRR